MGSGQIIKIAIKKYGIENFKKEILEYFDTPEDMFNKEHEIVNESLINDPNCYNITLGGKGNKKNYVYAYDINENVYYVLKNDKRFKTGELRYKLLIIDIENNKKWIFNDDPKYLSGEYKSILSDYVSVKDKDNNNLRVSKNDPRYLSGELKFNLDGKIVVKDKEGNTFSVSKNDPRFLNGELHQIVYGTVPVYINGKIKRVPKEESFKYVNIFKNKAVVKNDKGEIFQVDIDNPDYISGKYKGHSFGKIPVIDKDGNTFSVSVDDPKYISGEYKSFMHGNVIVMDDKGNKFRISQQDPRYISGELKQYCKGMVFVKDENGNKKYVNKNNIPTGCTNYFIKMKEVIDHEGRIFKYDINDLNFDKTGFQLFEKVRDKNKVVILVRDSTNKIFKCYNNNPNLLNKIWFPKFAYKFNGKRIYEFANNDYIITKPINNSYNRIRHVELYL